MKFNQSNISFHFYEWKYRKKEEKEIKEEDEEVLSDYESEIFQIKNCKMKYNKNKNI